MDSRGLSMSALFELKKRWIEMKWLIAAGGILVFLLLFGLYCCIVVGAREDRFLEELEWKGRQDADGENGAYCYFWHSRKQKCRKKRCYYLLPEERQDSICRENGMLGDCKVCPYGQHSPCIGYCLQKILLDLRQCRQK